MVCIFGVLSEERAPSSVIVPSPGVLPSPGERGPSSAFSPDPESSPLRHAGVETDWRWGVGVVEGLWKTRDNGGKAAWLFIGVLSRVYWRIGRVNYLRVLLPKFLNKTSLIQLIHLKIKLYFCIEMYVDNLYLSTKLISGIWSFHFRSINKIKITCNHVINVSVQYKVLLNLGELLVVYTK